MLRKVLAFICLFLGGMLAMIMIMALLNGVFTVEVLGGLILAAALFWVAMWRLTQK